MQQLISIIENYSEFEGICESTTFKGDLELSSFDTTCMVSDIENEIGVTISLKDFVKYKTVGELAQYIASLK